MKGLDIVHLVKEFKGLAIGTKGTIVLSLKKNFKSQILHLLEILQQFLKTALPSADFYSQGICPFWANNNKLLQID